MDISALQTSITKAKCLPLNLRNKCTYEWLTLRWGPTNLSPLESHEMNGLLSLAVYLYRIIKEKRMYSYGSVNKKFNKKKTTSWGTIDRCLSYFNYLIKKIILNSNLSGMLFFLLEKLSGEIYTHQVLQSRELRVVIFILNMSLLLKY